MNLNRVINIALVIIPASLAGGVLSIASVSAISFIDNIEKPQQGIFPYNELVTNFSESNDQVDKDVLKMYQERTVSLQYTIDGKEWHFGTAWYWGQSKKDPSRSCYATNIHVVDSLLKYNRNSQLDYADRFSFIPEINSSSKLHYQSYNNNNQHPNQNPSFSAVELEKINVMERVPTITTTLNHSYSDLVIFSTVTRLSNLPSWDFYYDDSIINNIIDNLPNLTFYIAGFPYHEKPTWTTGKYKWKADNKMKGYNTEPYVTTASKTFGRSGVNYFDSNYGLNIKAQGLPTNERQHYSYARQVVLPGLNFAGGSSGSLVTVLNETTGKLKPLGIYWGVYQSHTKNDPENIIYEGGIDLFFSSKYFIYPSFTKYEYDNTKF